jgi:hypothetical protein
MNTVLVAVAFLTLATVCGAAQSLPEGWRLPTAKDETGEWRYARDSIAKPYHVRLDIDGNGNVDDLWLLMPETGRAAGLFAFLRLRNGRTRIVQLAYISDMTPQEFYVDSLGAGRHLNMCGRGYECADGAGTEFTMTFDGVIFGYAGSASSVYYMDPDSTEFLREWLDD